MRTQRYFVSLIAAVAAAAFATAFAATTPAGEGLDAVKSSTLDEVYLRPSFDFANYRKVMVEPAKVDLFPGWRKSINKQREPSRWITVEQEQDLIRTASALMTSAVVEAFTAKGFEIVTAPGPGVLQVSPSTPDLFVNAPDTVTPTLQAQINQREAGDATLNLEIRDSASGAVVGRVSDRNTARQVQIFTRVTLISNQFWFDAMFSAWARNVAAELEMTRGAS
jgi:Protein of unknown function (DUF3313)